MSVYVSNRREVSENADLRTSGGLDDDERCQLASPGDDGRWIEWARQERLIRCARASQQVKGKREEGVSASPLLP